MNVRRRHARKWPLLWFGLVLLAVLLWTYEIDVYANERRSSVTYFWDGDAAANVLGMAVVGGLAAVATGGLVGLAWPWRIAGLFALIPFGLTIATFALLSAHGGETCAVSGEPCRVSAFFRFGGLVVVLGCIAVAALTSRAVANRRRDTEHLRPERSSRPTT